MQRLHRLADDSSGFVIPPVEGHFREGACAGRAFHQGYVPFGAQQSDSGIPTIAGQHHRCHFVPSMGLGDFEDGFCAICGQNRQQATVARVNLSAVRCQVPFRDNLAEGHQRLAARREP